MIQSPLSDLAPFDELTPAGLRELERALSTEWLETDGLGGYASATVVGCATRRYHGLLVARPPGSATPHVFLARLEEQVVGSDGRTDALSCARYPGLFCPEGFRTVVGFEPSPHPRTLHRAAGRLLAREVLRTRGAPTVLVRYASQEGEACELHLRPLLSCRDHHALTQRNDALDPRTERLGRGLRWATYRGLPPVTLTLSAPFEWDEGPTWYQRTEYPADELRGFFGVEDAWSPGTLRVRLAPGDALVLAATIAEPLEDPAAAWQAELRTRARVGGEPEPEPDLRRRLERSAEHFLYRDEAGRLGVIAGFPWLGERSRDTAIALPGLLLARGRVEDCGAALSGLVPHLSAGLLPAILGPGPDADAPRCADSSLWFARAVELQARTGGHDERLRDELVPALVSIAEHLLAGTPLLRIDEDALPWTPEGTTPPTWMDASIDGEPITPRGGCPVELAALWYALLAHLEQLAAHLPVAGTPRRWRALRRKARRAFLERFWIEDGSYLADVWRPEHLDASVRPNMVLAAALEASPLTRGQRAAIVARARQELLTPLGLRTLSPREPACVPRCGGSPAERERAAHQGSVHPWLLGPYCEASLRAASSRPREARVLSSLLDPLSAELEVAGLEHLSELYDGDLPHQPGGTIAQAWNEAELLRALVLLESSA